MTALPDLSTLPKRVHYAAKVLQELKCRDQEFATAYRESMSYSGVGLCGVLADIAKRIEVEDREAAERDALVEELAADLFEITYKVRRFDTVDEGLRQIYRTQARTLIESGWRKGDSA